MNFLKNYLIVFLLSIFISQSVLADMPRYLDFKYILNESDAGKKAQNQLN